MTTHTTPTPTPRRYRFAIGLLTGACVGAGLAIWMTPGAAAEMRARLSDSAKRLGKRASDQYRRATTTGDTPGDVSRNGHDEGVEHVAQDAHRIDRHSAAPKSEPRGTHS